MKRKNRDSNFELMRIISMLMIVFWHFIRNGPIFAYSSESTKIIMIFIECIMVVHVNSFVLLSGYYMCKKEFKLSKLFEIINSMWFYKALIPIVLLFFHLTEFNIVNLLKNISPIPYNEYWFMTVYTMLYVISPVLNIIIKNTTQQEHKRTIYILLIILSILPTITNQEFYNTQYGYSLGNFILLYLIGAYLQKYPFEKSEFGKNISKNKSQIIYIVLFFLLAFITGSIELSTDKYRGLGKIMEYLGNTIKGPFTAYNHPLIILQSMVYFLFFRTLSFHSKVINKIASTTLGVYFIHDNPLLIGVIFKWFDLYATRVYYPVSLLKFALFTIIVFTCCMIIEFMRQYLFSFIKNRKISIKIGDKIKKYIDEI